MRIRDVKGDPYDSSADEPPATPDEQKILDDMEKNDAKSKNSNDDDGLDSN